MILSLYIDFAYRSALYGGIMNNKHYLLRSPQHPFEVIPYSDLHSTIGNNVGNLVYVNGVVRALTITEQTSYETHKRDYDYSEAELDRINQTCDAFIITLADALRSNYAATLSQMTGFIKKLNIPCVVIGCGLRAKYEPKKDKKYPFDEEARQFFRAVLEKSARIGLRGQITADYLKHLGFREEQDYTVIGCPSLYMYGEDLPFRDTISEFLADRNAPVSFNISPNVSEKTYALISETAALYPESVYVPQNSKDELLMYYNKPFKSDKRLDCWPSSFDHPFYRDHEAYFFNNALSWIDFQRTRKISLGTRVHGNITAVVAGTPALFLPQSARSRELCDYHGFACLSPKEVDATDSLLDVIGGLDFARPQRIQHRNFSHYMDFLRLNGLSSIFDSDYSADAETPYDRKTEGFKDIPPLRSVFREPPEVLEQRLMDRDRSEHSRPGKGSGISKLFHRFLHGRG